MATKKSKNKSSKLSFLKILLCIFIISIILNFLWEFTHSYLYTCWNLTAAQYWPMIVMATLGDGLIISWFYIAGAIKRGSVKWLFKSDKSDYLFILFLGLTTSVLLEIINVYSLKRWSYKPAMPLIPILKIGITPIIQLMITPILTFNIVKKLLSKSNV